MNDLFHSGAAGLFPCAGTVHKPATHVLETSGEQWDPRRPRSGACLGAPGVIWLVTPFEFYA